MTATVGGRSVAAEILEEGRVYFFYRPRVDRTEVDDIEDVQRLFMVLRPRGTDRFRLLLIGRKRLPRVEEAGERSWVKVAEIIHGVDDLNEALGPRTYDTRTRGRRHQPKARPVGDGVYILARHDDHTHLAYELLDPPEPGEAQRELNIEREASYIVTVRNPEAPPPPGFRPGGPQPAFPERLLSRFGGRRFAPVDPAEFLDHEGTDLVLIGASGDVARELEIDLDSEAERIGIRDVFEELRLSRDRQQADPLLKGRWS